MNRTDIRETLNEESIRLTKSLGQNLLHDQNVLRRIVRTADLQPDDEVLEIGPGLGALTEHLLSETNALLAIEKDKRLVTHLQRRYGSNVNFKLIHHDAMDYFLNRETDWSNWKVVSNLPYSVASPLVVDMALMPKGPRQLVITLQQEVAQRICAKPGTKEYGKLTLLVQSSYIPGNMFKISSNCFFPEPKVESSCLALHRREKPLLTDSLRKPFTTVVKQAFSQRRKMMRKNLCGNWLGEAVDSAMTSAGLDVKIRAEKVTLEQFVELTRRLHDA